MYIDRDDEVNELRSEVESLAREVNRLSFELDNARADLEESNTELENALNSAQLWEGRFDDLASEFNAQERVIDSLRDVIDDYQSFLRTIVASQSSIIEEIEEYLE